MEREILSCVTVECQFDLGLEGRWGFKKRSQVPRVGLEGILGGGESTGKMLRQESVNWSFTLAEAEGERKIRLGHTAKGLWGPWEES